MKVLSTLLRYAKFMLANNVTLRFTKIAGLSLYGWKACYSSALECTQINYALWKSLEHRGGTISCDYNNNNSEPADEFPWKLYHVPWHLFPLNQHCAGLYYGFTFDCEMSEKRSVLTNGEWEVKDKSFTNPNCKKKTKVIAIFIFIKITVYWKLELTKCLLFSCT